MTRRLVYLILGLVATSCLGSMADADPPNVLLIVSEDNGPELGCYGDPYARTPHLDRLAAEGMRFENAFVPYSVCSPSRAAFLTGLYPHQNGQIGLATHKFAMYDEHTPNMASLLKAAGYHTGLIGKLHINPESAFPFDMHAIPSANFQRRQSVADYAAAAGRFFRESTQQPFFLSVNYPDAHLPFLRQANGRPVEPLDADDVSPMPWVGVDTPRLREQVANYYNCLERLDEGVQLLLDELADSGRSDDTLVIYFGDHGAQFPRGKGTVYEGALRVPLIIRWPGHVEPGIVRRELVSTIDLLPTVLEAAQIPGGSLLPGRPLQPLFGTDDDVAWRKHIFAMTTGAYPRACFVQHSVRGERFKLISSPQPEADNLDAQTYLDPSHPQFVITGARPEEQARAPGHVREAFARWSRPPRYELYDLQADPSEWNDLAEDPDFAETKNRLIRALTDWQRRTGDPFLDPINVNAFTHEQLANRDLAYRKDPEFHWSYLIDFARWREEAAKPSIRPGSRSTR